MSLREEPEETGGRSEDEAGSEVRSGTDGGAASGDAGGEGMKAEARGTRRFPAVTRDTARPEGGQRAMGAEHAAPYRQWPLLAVCCGVLVGLLVTIAEFRAGTLIIGLSLLGGAALRRFVPSVGMLAVRSAFTDMLTYGLLGLAVCMLAMLAQPDPWLSIPILEEILHFTVRSEEGGS
jgi:hypothetical protein